VRFNPHKQLPLQVHLPHLLQLPFGLCVRLCYAGLEDGLSDFVLLSRIDGQKVK
jgi:hypothetical protein